MKIIIRRRAEKQLAKLPSPFRKKILEKILNLSTNPVPRQSIRLTNKDGYRMRIGVYRMIYEISKKNKEVSILSVQHRKDAYRY